MILIIIVIMIFVGMVVFLLQLASNVSREEFTALYATNLLLSVMRTDTGYSDSNCKLVSDLVFCAYFKPDWVCGDSQINCLELANSTIAKYMTIFGNETKSLKYLFTITTPESIAWDQSGEPISLDIGDNSLKKSKTESFKLYSHSIVLIKNQYTLKMQLIVAKK